MIQARQSSRILLLIISLTAFVGGTHNRESTRRFDLLRNPFLWNSNRRQDGVDPAIADLITVSYTANDML